MTDLAPIDAAEMRPALTELRRWPDCATLWGTPSGAMIFEIDRTDGLISPGVITALDQALARAVASRSGLVLTSTHPQLFAFGAAGPFRDTIRSGNTAPSFAFLIDGQQVLMGLRGAPVPVVAAIHGAAFSGACEIALFANGLVIEETAPVGLKEIWMGLIPGWGGHCQLIRRHLAAGDPPLSAACTAFTQCARGHVATGEAEGHHARLLRPGDHTVTDRADLIPAALRRIDALAAAPRAAEIPLTLPDDTAALTAHIEALDSDLRFSPAEVTAMQALLALFTAAPGTTPAEADHMTREAHAFLPLLTPGLGPRSAHFAATGQRPPADL